MMYDLEFTDSENYKTQIVFDEKRGFGFDNFYDNEVCAYEYADENLRGTKIFNKALKFAKRGYTSTIHMEKRSCYKKCVITKTNEHEASLLRKLD